jgi:hypothetical protein
MAAGRIIKHGGPRVGDSGLDVIVLEFLTLLYVCIIALHTSVV